MLETNKQALLFNFGEDLSYFVILRYKLRDFIKSDDYVNARGGGGEGEGDLLTFMTGVIMSGHFLRLPIC